MDEKRLRQAFGLAHSLFRKDAARFAEIADLNDEESMCALKSSAEEHMRKCFWVAVYGFAELDKQYIKLAKRVRK